MKMLYALAMLCLVVMLGGCGGTSHPGEKQTEDAATHTKIQAIVRGSEILNDEFVGEEYDQFIAKYGEPSAKSDGALPLRKAGSIKEIRDEYRKKYGETIGLSYKRNEGTYDVFFNRQNGKWICFSSLWIPKGAFVD
jgi:hypothetical protein